MSTADDVRALAGAVVAEAHFDPTWPGGSTGGRVCLIFEDGRELDVWATTEWQTGVLDVSVERPRQDSNLQPRD